MIDFFKSEEFLKFKKQANAIKLKTSNIHCHAPFTAARLLGDTIGVCHNHHNEDTDREQLRREIESGDLNDKCRYCEVRHKYSKDDFLEIILGNNCNNNCKICSPLYSKNIYTIENIANPIGELKLSQRLIDLINEIGHTAKEIEFIGGETFLYSKQIIYILERCKNVKKIHIVTNGSIYDKKLFDYLSLNKITLQLFISIDGTPRTQGYMRGGSDYNTVIKNIKEYDTHSNVNCCINTAVSILNVLDLNEVVKCIHDRLPYIPISTTVVHTPMEYSLPNIQDDKLRKEILTELEKLRYNSKVVNKESLISFAEAKNKVNIVTMIKKTIEMLDVHDRGIGKNSIDYMNKKMYKYIIESDRRN